MDGWTSDRIATHFLASCAIPTHNHNHTTTKTTNQELLVASNANVGGPTTAAAMAGSKRWKSLVLPGILTGIFGYATATFLGLALGRRVLLPLMARAAAAGAAGAGAV